MPAWSHSDDWARRYRCEHEKMRIAMPFITVGRENSDPQGERSAVELIFKY